MNAQNRLLFILLIAAAFTAPGAAQAPPIVTASPENGRSVPVHGEFRAFMVFAELDWLACGNTNEQNGEWAENQLPPYRDQIFDHVVSDPPVGVHSDYYYQMSFGQYRVQGDYYPEVITMPCNPRPSAANVIAAIRTMHGPGGVRDGQPMVTAHGHGLEYFDQWTPSGAYQPKHQVPNQYLDMVLVIWRNYCENTQSKCLGGSGSIRDLPTSITLGGGIQGYSIIGQFVGGSVDSLTGILIHEFNHPVLGGNNWHVAWGAGTQAQPFPQGAVGMLASSPTPTNAASAWDRHQLGWTHPSKVLPISALSTGATPVELPSDISIQTHPNGAEFLLRDFMVSGDAIRIKLPHISWGSLGDTKNQYLWLENRQNLLRRFDGTSFSRDRLFDRNAFAEGNPCAEKWLPGVHAYIQIGKEKDLDLVGAGGVAAKDGIVNASDIDSGDPRHPNSLASFLFPLTADGNVDFNYRLDHVEPVPAPGVPAPCQFDNALFPVDRVLSLPNPFTGHSDIFVGADSDNFLSRPPATFIPFGNGVMFSNEVPKAVYADFVNGSVIPHLRQGGDAGDTFNIATGKRRLSIGTNPAPVPVYTMATDVAINGTIIPNTQFDPRNPPSYDNRTIWLNGLSVEITNELFLGSLGNGVYVRIRWDDYKVAQDARWSGNIVLQNDAVDPLQRQSRVILAQGRNLYLDRGLSPAQHVANATAEQIDFPAVPSPVYPAAFAAEAGQLFTQPTTLTIRPGAKLHLARNAVLWLLNGSTLNVEVGAEILLEPGAEIRQGPGGGTCMVGGNAVDCQARSGAIHMLGDLSTPATPLNNCVDLNDLRGLLAALGGPVNPFLDLNEDNRTDIADARTLVTFFTNAFGAPCMQ